MFSVFTHVMKPVRDTNSEPGLPVVHKASLAYQIIFNRRFRRV